MAALILAAIFPSFFLRIPEKTTTSGSSWHRPGFHGRGRAAQAQEAGRRRPGRRVPGIGGLIAGKVLAKVGLFAIILKFWKLGLLAAGGTWATIKRFLGFGTREEG